MALDPLVGEVSRAIDDRTGLTQGRTRFAYLYVLGHGAVAGSAKMAYAMAYRWIDDPKDFAELPLKRRIKAQDYGNRLLDKVHVRRAVEQYQRDLGIETDQSRATWVARAVEMREECMNRGKEQALAKLHRDIGDALGHFTTKIEISSVPRSGDIISEIAELFKAHPQLIQLTMNELRGVDLVKMIESRPVEPEPAPPPPTWEGEVQSFNPGACP